MTSTEAVAIANYMLVMVAQEVQFIMASWMLCLAINHLPCKHFSTSMIAKMQICKTFLFFNLSMK